MNDIDRLREDFREHSFDEPRPTRYRTLDDVDREFLKRLGDGPLPVIADNRGADRAELLGEFEVTAVDDGTHTICDRSDCVRCNRVAHDTLQREIRTERSGGSGDKGPKKARPKATKQSEKNDLLNEGKTDRLQIKTLTPGEREWYENRRDVALMVLRQEAARIRAGQPIIALPQIPGRKPRRGYAFSLYGLNDDDRFLYAEIAKGAATAALVRYARGCAGGWIDRKDGRVDPAAQSSINAFGTTVSVAA